MDEDRHLCTDFELCPVCQLCEGGCCECTEQERLFPMADSEEIAMEAIFEARCPTASIDVLSRVLALPTDDQAEVLGHLCAEFPEQVQDVLDRWYPR